MGSTRSIAAVVCGLALAGAARGVDTVLWIAEARGNVAVGRVGGESFETKFSMGSRVRALASRGSVIFAGNIYGRLVKFDPAVGEVVEVGVIPGDNEAMVVNGDELLVSASDGNIRRVDIATGAVVDTYPISGGHGLPALAIGGGAVWASDGDRNIYTGAPTGPFTKFTKFIGFPATGMAIAGAALIVSTVEHLHVVSTEDGSVIASFDVMSNGEDVEVHGGEVLLGTLHAGIFRVDPGTGEVLGTFATGVSVQSMTIADGLCVADFTGDGRLDINDFLAMRAAFVAGDPRADISGDGVLTINDFIVFQAAFRKGC